MTSLNVLSKGRHPGARPVRKRRRRKPMVVPWLLPATGLLVAVVGYPTVLMVIASTSSQNLTGSLTGWTGLSNYRKVLNDPVLVDVFKNTIVWTISIVFITIVLSLAIALLLNAAWPGRKLVRAMLIVPWASSLAITSLIFRWMLDSQFGAINVTLLHLHFIGAPIRFLSRSSTSFPALIAIGVFVSIPFTTYLLLAGLQTVPDETYQAASLDGAGWIRQIWYMSIPMIGRFISLAVLMNMIYVFNSFPIIWIITGGGPANETDTIITYVYRQAFVTGNVTGASAISTLSVIFLSAFGLLYWRLFGSRGYAGT